MIKKTESERKWRNETISEESTYKKKNVLEPKTDIFVETDLS